MDPDKIILFGSRAPGDQRPDSNVDLLIVKPSVDPPHRRVIPACQAMAGLLVPTDNIVAHRLGANPTAGAWEQ